MTDRQAIELMEAFIALAKACRRLRARNGVPEGKVVTMFIKWPDPR